MQIWQPPEEPIAQQRKRKPIEEKESPAGWTGIKRQARSNRALQPL
jgi:hypothetical protein